MQDQVELVNRLCCCFCAPHFKSALRSDTGGPHHLAGQARMGGSLQRCAQSGENESSLHSALCPSPASLCGSALKAMLQEAVTSRLVDVLIPLASMLSCTSCVTFVCLSSQGSACA